MSLAEPQRLHPHRPPTFRHHLPSAPAITTISTSNFPLSRPPLCIDTAPPTPPMFPYTPYTTATVPTSHAQPPN
ncbi:uncharacterized protein M6B38_397555 [Iris pallida]|uniref:Uncharacterized protein n=1 Tax=Iris pallida TaxID=29817 RepID=A0AAX6FIM2_IRIPA|nr:uncharacterized protein M6B38_417000 [Iris pallida]KAJ6820608.1 uncharacterized protein M6B38_397555 [Iris pallida]